MAEGFPALQRLVGMLRGGLESLGSERVRGREGRGGGRRAYVEGVVGRVVGRVVEGMGEGEGEG